MNKPEKAVNCFMTGPNCSMAIFSTFGPEFGVDEKTALKIASAFGGGMARMGQTCGAVTGAFMVLGLTRYAAPLDTNDVKKEKLYSLVRAFTDEFKLRNKSINCREILGCDLSTREGSEMFKKNDLHRTICAKCVRDSAEILEKLIKDLGDGPGNPGLKG
jgi:C_GCAxxG_C_C family probable redox protein